MKLKNRLFTHSLIGEKKNTPGYKLLYKLSEKCATHFEIYFVEAPFSVFEVCLWKIAEANIRFATASQLD